jgi:hypothetical protein
MVKVWHARGFWFRVTEGANGSFEGHLLLIRGERVTSLLALLLASS